jgi:hypothetical protein
MLQARQHALARAAAGRRKRSGQDSREALEMMWNRGLDNFAAEYGIGRG